MENGTHTTFWKSITKVTPFSNKGPILHRDRLSFHLSHQPPLLVMCNFYVVKMSLLGGKVSLSLHKKWHITDRGGWWLKWKLILSQWRIGPSFENGVTFVIDFQNVACVLLIKSVLCNGCLQPLGHLQGCMIPFRIGLLRRVLVVRFFPVRWQFDKFFALLNIRNPGQHREGTSSTFLNECWE